MTFAVSGKTAATLIKNAKILASDIGKGIAKASGTALCKLRWSLQRLVFLYQNLRRRYADRRLQDQHISDWQRQGLPCRD